MKKIIVLSLGLILSWPVGIYAISSDVCEPFNCGVFSAQEQQLKDKYCDLDIKDVRSDVDRLAGIYNCILAENKNVSKDANHNIVVSQALVLENDAIHYINTLLAKQKDLASRGYLCAKVEGQAPSSERVALLKSIIQYVDSIAKNARTLAKGTYAVSKIDNNAGKISSLKTEVDALKKNDDGTDRKFADGSLLLALDNTTKDKNIVSISNTSDKDKAINNKMETILTGDYKTSDKLNDFAASLKNKKYDISALPDSPSGDGPGKQQDGNKPNANSNTNSNANNNSTQALMDQLLKDQKDKIKQLEDKINNSNNNNNSNGNSSDTATTASTQPSSVNSGSGGGLGSVGSSIGNRFGMDDDTRKELLERAREREKMAVRSDLHRMLYGSETPNKRALRSPSLGASNSSGTSLRDLFMSSRAGSGDSSQTAPSVKKGTVPSIFDTDNDNKKGDERYSEYFKNGVAPKTFSTKEMAMNTFASMYDAARLKALTEDAYQEFAGRYIDLFLLIHTIMDNEYRKGKIMDVGEMIPSPLGPVRKTDI